MNYENARLSVNVEDRRLLTAPWRRPPMQRALANPSAFVFLYAFPPDWILRVAELCIAEQRWVQLPADDPKTTVRCRIGHSELSVTTSKVSDRITRTAVLCVSMGEHWLDWGGHEDAIRTVCDAFELRFGLPFT